MASLQLLAPGKGRREKARKLNDGRREIKKEKAVSRRNTVTMTATTATLMETQEYGEMMECVDEVDFALDGLRRGQGVRVRRASLLSLLNVCGSPHHRRLLKAQGMAKTIIDTILNLSLDDSPSNLAAATLFYVLTSDGQDSYLLDSFPSVRFLLKLLKPVVAETAPEKAPSISQKLLALRKDLLLSQDMTKKTDSSSSTLIQKVLETFVSCKDLKASNAENDDFSRPELNPNWVSLLTLEKACLSSISIEDTTGTVRKTGGKFKEKLRELGGLDAVFELAINFHSTLEDSIEHVTASTRKLKNGKLQSLPLLLKCLKIMENSTFLSKENQSHLLGLKGNLAAGQGSSLSFVKLMISFIKILSELALLRISSTNSSPEMPTSHSNGSDRYREFNFNAEQKVDSNGVFSFRSSQECSSSGRYSSDTGLSTSQTSQRLSSNSGATTGFGVGNCLLEKAASSFGSGSCSQTSKSSSVGAPATAHSSKTKLALAKSPYDDDDDMFIDLEDSQDPFAFDEEDLAPSKWETLRGRHRGQRKQKRRPSFRNAVEECFSLPMFSQEDSVSQTMLSQEDFCNGEQNVGNRISSDTSCTTAIDEENSGLVADCLLTAIKVLMNLTNDNAVGCEQIAACGGLETLSSLIARHFPKLSVFTSSEKKEKTLFAGTTMELESQTDIHLNDQELDFLVTILGLLVNMVENNGDNRLVRMKTPAIGSCFTYLVSVDANAVYYQASRLAAAEVSLQGSSRLSEVHTGVIPLLCSIFLANRGAGEAAEEELQSLDAEEVVLQGEKEAEKMIVEAYAALLLAFLSTESKSIRSAIANYLPDHSLKILVPVLERFVTFHLTLNMISPETHRTVSEVIESCTLP
uniref:Wings apart-like protein C-terminal domain-containing protein n=1 Tax=Chenopodium quinoa TaxID=63459 RepID=A0A803LLD8_CHEQI